MCANSRRNFKPGNDLRRGQFSTRAHIAFSANTGATVQLLAGKRVDRDRRFPRHAVSAYGNLGRKPSVRDAMCSLAPVLRGAGAGSEGSSVSRWRAPSFPALLPRNYVPSLPVTVGGAMAFVFPVLPISEAAGWEFSNLGPLATAGWGFFLWLCVLTPLWIVVLVAKLFRRAAQRRLGHWPQT
jgi:hypothetical protein